MTEAAYRPEGWRVAVDPAAIRGAVDERPQGPWAALERDEVDRLLGGVVDDLVAHPGLFVRHVDWTHYGCGLSSLVPVVLVKDRADAASEQMVEGVVLALCRLAPIACISNPELTGGLGMPYQGQFLDPTDTSWHTTSAAVDDVLGHHDVARLPATVLNQPIEPGLEIDTNFGGEPFTVFDAWFHWWD